MKLGLISDTHDHVEHVRQAVDLFQQRGVDLTIHCGDISSPFIIRALRGLPVAGVLGNNDGEKYGLARAYADIGGRFGGDFMTLDLTEPDKRAAVYHGTVPAITRALGLSGEYDLVITGHTHHPVNELIGTTRMLNPGSCHGYGKRATVMIFDTCQDHADVIELT
ncbi:metallophosphoesterase [Magnetofaba australis]|uniref:Phosphoesterase n=1 Tax=Magnetofaba australis IT-1 TaxID=1434232 RepID=A0A1Y2K6N5_9PROT|nr:metallophosphoesterase [Magnetofaba australis]OSM05324.1 putative phosphodiesterase [Magnetofaba australis IT-1]